jgi:hypothetical protein
MHRPKRRLAALPCPAHSARIARKQRDGIYSSARQRVGARAVHASVITSRCRQQRQRSSSSSSSGGVCSALAASAGSAVSAGCCNGAQRVDSGVGIGSQCHGSRRRVSVHAISTRTQSVSSSTASHRLLECAERPRPQRLAARRAMFWRSGGRGARRRPSGQQGQVRAGHPAGCRAPGSTAPSRRCRSARRPGLQAGEKERSGAGARQRRAVKLAHALRRRRLRCAAAAARATCRYG